MAASGARAEQSPKPIDLTIALRCESLTDFSGKHIIVSIKDYKEAVATADAARDSDPKTDILVSYQEPTLQGLGVREGRRTIVFAWSGRSAGCRRIDNIGGYAKHHHHRNGQQRPMVALPQSTHIRVD
jgi:hypothetical protein